MTNPYFFPLHPSVVSAVQESDVIYVIVGAGGWIGRAMVEYLANILGNEAKNRILLFGSTARQLSTYGGAILPVHSLDNLPDLPIDRPCLLFHFAFLTMDKVGGMSEADYVMCNQAIRTRVASLVSHLPVRGLAVLSSGAIYDLIRPRLGRDPAANLYGRLKYEDEFYFEGLARALELSYVCPRVFNLSGPYINKPEVYALASFILAALSGQDIEIRATHPVIRAYLPVQQLIELQLLLLHMPDQVCERFDFSGEKPLELAELAQLISSRYGVGIQRANIAPGAIKDCYLGDYSRLKQLEFSLALESAPISAQITNTAAYLADMQKIGGL